MPQPKRPSRRPTLEESAQVDALVRKAAISSFLDRGFSGTTMDGVAQLAGVTRATLYARYADKRALFKDVIHWALKEREEGTEPAIDVDDARGSLLALARASFARATDPEGVRLSVLLMTESPRFPDLAPKAHQFARYPHVQLVIDVLERQRALGSIEVEDPELAAELFLSMVASHPARMAAFGMQRTAEAEDRYLARAVDVFLDGLRAR